MSLEDRPSIPLSHYGRSSVEPSPVGRMMASFAADFRDGVDINLGVGYVNEETIPRELILDAMEHVLTEREDHRVALNYGGPAGSPNLVRSLKSYIRRFGVGGLSEDHLDKFRIIIGASGATSLLEAVSQVLPRGIVVTSDPHYYIFANYLRRFGYRILAIPEDHDGIRVDLLGEKLASLSQADRQAVSFFYLVTIGNPTSSILSNERRRELLRVANAFSADVGHTVPILMDRAYEDLIHDPGVPPTESALIYEDSDCVFEIGTLSKVLAPALRIGYMIGRDGDFLRAIVQRVSDTGFSAPLITQEIASHMLDHHVAGQIKNVNQTYREKAGKVGAALREELGPYLEDVIGGRAGFYYYLTFRDIRTDEGSPFYRFLSRTTGEESVDGPADNPHPRVVYLPGSFSVSADGDMVEKGRRQLRISYAFEETTHIIQSVKHMRHAAEYAAP
ncbi:MAG: aminotransferase class I/II-fold pyridoxal phosphate-dependent enzyme [Candidatus Sumerlaeota bacterium]